MPRRHLWIWTPRRLAQRETGCTTCVWLPRGSLFPSSDWLQTCSGRRVSGEKPTLTRAGVGGTRGLAEVSCFAWQEPPLT